MSFPARFDPPAFVREIEDAALDGDWTIRHLSPTAASTRPWLHRAAPSGPGAPAVYLSAGIHGDEISGPFALLKCCACPISFAIST